MKYLLSIMLLVTTNIVAAGKPSFDCNLASTKSESEICSNSSLGDLDNELSKVYLYGMKTLPHDKKEILKQNQRAWIKGRESPFPNLSEYMKTRIRALHTLITSPKIKLPSPPSINKFSFEFHDDTEEEFITDSLLGYLNKIGDRFLIDGVKIADRYSSITVKEFNRIKPMTVYYGPARLHGVESGGKTHCYNIWELYISLGAKWRYLHEYIDVNGHKIELTDLAVSNADLYKCEEFGGALKMVFWTNSEQARHTGEVDSMQFTDYIYSIEENKLIEVSKYSVPELSMYNKSVKQTD